MSTHLGNVELIWLEEVGFGMYSKNYNVMYCLYWNINSILSVHLTLCGMRKWFVSYKNQFYKRLQLTYKVKVTVHNYIVTHASQNYLKKSKMLLNVQFENAWLLQFGNMATWATKCFRRCLIVADWVRSDWVRTWLGLKLWLYLFLTETILFD